MGGTSPTGNGDSHVMKSNIPLLTAAFLAALTTGGNTYAFGLYGSALKSALELTQSQLDTISSANFCAGLLSWIPGGFADKYGPRFALTLGGIAGAASMMSYWLVAREFIPLPRPLLIPILCTLGVLIFLSNSMVIGGVFKIFVVTCGPETKGSAVGCAKAYVGLGSGAYACMFQSFRSQNSSDLDFLPFAAFCAILAATIPARLLLPNKEGMHFSHAYDKVTPWHLRSIYFGLIGLGSMVVGTSIASILAYDESHDNNADDDGDASSTRPNYWMTFLLFAFWFGPIVALLVIPPRQDEQGEDEFVARYEAPVVALHSVDKASDGSASPDRSFEREHDTRDGLMVDTSGDVTSEQQIVSQQEEGYTLWEMVRTVPAWLFAYICIISVGGGTIMTNNMGQMVEALYLPKVVTPASLALFSAAQAASRVVTGIVSDAAQKWKSVRFFGNGGGVPRPAFLVAASLAEALAHSVLSLASSQVMFVIGVALSGAAFGMIWPLMVLIVGEVFGNANVGANYMAYDGGASALGTLLLSKFLAQSVYESHIDENDENSDGVTCYGEECFQASHITIAVLSLTCVVASILMVKTTRHAYSRHDSHADYGAMD